ncbi:hypothetical protein BS78_09G002000 [Paspalum vaginatum]|nr:hypothetical protein BS78_09G002000 [Paspalum vaginatum]
MSLGLSSLGVSESEVSAEALPWLAEAATTGRWPTLQESRELEKRMDFLMEQINSVYRDMYLATDEFPPSDAREDFLLLAEVRRRALLQELRCLASQKMDPDLSAMSESDRAAEVERLRREKLQEAHRLMCQGDTQGFQELQGKARMNHRLRSQAAGHLLQQSPAGPMRFTDRPPDKMIAAVDHAAINVLSVKIACSDIGFPIQVYGAVFARDCVDYKRVYLFNRDSDHCQLINSEKEALILTGPKRGLALSYRNDYVETDLWVKDCNGYCRQFSRGIVKIPGTATQNLDKGEAERVSLATRLSTVDVTYDVVKLAMEATVAVEVLQGEFNGKMAAHTTSSKRKIVLYDGSTGGNYHGVIRLTRPAVSVYVKDKLIILVKTAAGDYKGIKFAPRWNDGVERVLTLSDVTMRVKVVWSMINP